MSEKKKTLSRREFLRGAAGTAGIAALGMLTACGNPSPRMRETSTPLALAIHSSRAALAALEVTVAPETPSMSMLCLLRISSASSAVEEGAKTILIEKMGEEYGGSGVRDTLAPWR